MRLPIYLFVIITFSGCNLINNKSSEKEIVISMNQSLESIDDLKKSVIFEGDKKAYRSLSFAYLDSSFSEEFLLYALIMANKYDYPEAYFDVFRCLTGVFFNDLTRIDQQTASVAVKYLIIASEKHHRQAKDIVEKNNISIEEDSREQILRIYPQIRSSL
ncbi:MAG: hypothetical protein Q8S18_08760 [Bacteroidales bacterium]|nr:hypothetical protein [Bacteroidales bacterium]